MAVLRVTVVVQLDDRPPIVRQQQVDHPDDGAATARHWAVAEVIAEQGTYALVGAGRLLGLTFDDVRGVHLDVHDRVQHDNAQSGTQTA